MFSHAPLLLCPIFLKGKCVSVGPSRRNSKVTLRVAVKEAERSCIHTRAHLSLCPGMLGGQQQQMVCIGSYCLTMQQQGVRCPVQPWPKDTIVTSCISVTVNLLPIIKASPSGSNWQQRVAGGQIESSRCSNTEQLSRSDMHTHRNTFLLLYLKKNLHTLCSVSNVTSLKCQNPDFPVLASVFNVEMLVFHFLTVLLVTVFNWPSFGCTF